jgi:hypothetical protein
LVITCDKLSTQASYCTVPALIRIVSAQVASTCRVCSVDSRIARSASAQPLSMTVSAATEPASAIAVVSLIAGPAHAPDWPVLFPFLSMVFSIPASAHPVVRTYHGH